MVPRIDLSFLLCDCNDRFAQLATAVFLNKGFKVYLFSQHTPTPYNVSALYVCCLTLAIKHTYAAILH